MSTQQKRRPANKAELVRIREELRLSREGLELLERKRDALMAQGLQLLRQSREQREEVTGRWQEAIALWRTAMERDGEEQLAVRSMHCERIPSLQGDEERMLSVSHCRYLVTYLMPKLLGGVGDCSLCAELARGKLAKLLPELIELMNRESNVRRVAAALKQCQRQVNALSQVVIPELAHEQKRIEQRIEEKEREAMFQVKRLKAAHASA